MFAYKTAEEKATEWGVTIRHIQYLCRTGKIEGAEKRAGAWFIPDEASNPLKNTRGKDKPFEFIGTKKSIFDNAIKLFTQKGYENVSINDIADSVGIRQSAVYNHFSSKQEILDTIYGFYYHHWILNRPNMDYLETLLKNNSKAIDIITKGFLYNFEEDILEQMSDVVKIIMQRVSVDPKATGLFQKLLLEEGIDFVENGLNRAIETGRFRTFDTHIVSVLINCARLYRLLWWITGPSDEIIKKLEKEEMAVYELISSFLPGTSACQEKAGGSSD
ncbi:MAG: TetR/AcrR family transcriptional regulator [Treponema sp.]|jgi:AcrR family transcriptional regulator|nr:TetR/AcrR family transcriptional regulator [Treponema sp.]